MVNTIRVYLSGSIQKGKDDPVKKSIWTDSDIHELHEILDDSFKVLFMNPASRSDDMCDHESVLGRDLMQVFISDLILVDARDRKGIGIGGEMLFAKCNGVPVISVAPPDTRYRRSHLEYMGQSINNWVHPFIGGLSDYVADSVRDAAAYIKENYPFEKSSVKNGGSLFLMMQHYIETQFKKDSEMYDLAAGDNELRKRIEDIKNKDIHIR